MWSGGTLPPPPPPPSTRRTQRDFMSHLTSPFSPSSPHSVRPSVRQSILCLVSTSEIGLPPARARHCSLPPYSTCTTRGALFSCLTSLQDDPSGHWNTKGEPPRRAFYTPSLLLVSLASFKFALRPDFTQPRAGLLAASLSRKALI